MTDRFHRNLRLGYGFSLLILLVVGFVSYLAMYRLLKTSRTVTHSSEVIQKLEKLLSTIKDAETGQRGYLLTGKPNFLEPYNGAYRTAEELNSELARLTDDNSIQRKNIAAIRKILHQRLDILQNLVIRKQHNEEISAADLDADKAAMDALRLAVAKAEKDEKILLTIRSSSLNEYTGRVPLFIIITFLLAVVISFYSYHKVTSDFREKEQMRRNIEQQEDETQALNEELTAANEEITATLEELTVSNEELYQAREELISANESLEQRVVERTKALKESEEEAQALNEELTAINEEMAATNEELMATNDDLAESERKLRDAYEELKAGEERSAKLAAIVESSDDAIIGKDLNGIITAWNRGAKQIFGYAEDEIVGESVLQLIPEDRQHEEPMILSQLRKGEKIDHYETVRRRRDGQLIDVSLTISPIHDKEGHVIGVSKIARDITEQKRDDQRKNDFIGMASHELKTPLTSLLALVQVLQLKVRSTEDEFTKNALNKVAYQARKMTSLINGFLNVSRLESGKLIIEKQNFDLTDLIREMIADISMTVVSHTFLFEPPAEIRVLADRDKIGSVISNLLSNAVKYSPKGKLVTVTCTSQSNQVQVGVKDEGIGINSQDKDKLFDRYYRVQSEHTKHISGFGVGLYLSAEIIHRHEGRIWVESEKGAGSTFYFTLPLMA